MAPASREGGLVEDRPDDDMRVRRSVGRRRRHAGTEHRPLEAVTRTGKMTSLTRHVAEGAAVLVAAGLLFGIRALMVERTGWVCARVYARSPSGCEQACDLGSAPACIAVGHIKARGLPFDDSREKAFAAHERACWMGDPHGCELRGRLGPPSGLRWGAVGPANARRQGP
jgi:hypothetical protein